MGIIAAIAAGIGIICQVLALFGVSPDGTDLAILGLVFYGITLLCMNVPVRVTR